MSKTKIDFKVLKLPLTKDFSNSHEIFFKEHTVREINSEKPKGRTLFILNVPPFVDEDGIKQIFQEAGSVESVILSNRPIAGDQARANFKYFSKKDAYTFKVAYLVFSDPSGLQNAMRLQRLSPLMSNSHRICTGLPRWIKQYNESLINVDDLSFEIKHFMEDFDNKAKKESAAEKMLAEPDEDGWVTVTKKGRKPGFSRSENVESKIIEKEKQGSKRKELKNFYTFQIREAKMKHLATLRQKFEEDKNKIALLRQSRKFKPF